MALGHYNGMGWIIQLSCGMVNSSNLQILISLTVRSSNSTTITVERRCARPLAVPGCRQQRRAIAIWPRTNSLSVFGSNAFP